MNLITNPIILVTFFPLVGVLALLFIPSEKKGALRWTALVTSLLTFGLSIWLLTMFDKSNPDLQLGFTLPWIQVAGWNISFAMGVDGLSILLVLLTRPSLLLLLLVLLVALFALVLLVFILVLFLVLLLLLLLLLL